MKELKEYIRSTREENKLTLQKLADISKVDPQIIEDLEEKNMISSDVALLRIARSLKLDPLIILGKGKFKYLETRMKNEEFLSKNSCIKTIYCGSWDSFINYYTQNMFESKDKDLIWRGHKDSNWKLESTLLREYREGGITDDMLIAIIEKFKKSTLGNKERIEMEKIKGNIEKDEELMFWLSLGQHHGLKTPLLDWTYSPYVASYFAYVDSGEASTYRVIYALDSEILNMIIEMTGEDIKIVESENHFNKRLINQQGLFIYGPLDYHLEKWIEENSFINDKVILYKFMIPNSERKTILKLLNKMNINPKSLFPDLTGASNHVNLEIELEI
ncbi:MAG: FRG domain-containing protein [Cetobacterium sp.]|uniref:FRG domain-containing protein n=1 Tax=Cetobacterium sp. TaxID=2071632 RepID=UPI003EE5FD7B